MDLIEGTYKDDLDITTIHIKMLREFKDAKDKLPIIENRISELENDLRKPLYVIERKGKSREIDKLREQYRNIKDNIKRDEYVNRTKDIIEEYCSLPRMKKQIVFTSSGADIVHDETYNRRQLLIVMYLSILKNFINIDIVKHIYHNDIVRSAIELSSLNKDSSVEVPSRNNYENRENFRKAMLYYQCKVDITFPIDLYSKLDSFFTKYSKLVGAEVKKLNTNHEWHFMFTSKELMFKALAEIGYNSYYKHFYTICHEYWGWHRRDITNIEDEIMEEYDITQRVYETIKGEHKKKISSMNVQYKLLWLLKRKRHICEVRDFKIIKTPEILDDYEEVRKLICDKLGWPFEHIL